MKVRTKRLRIARKQKKKKEKKEEGKIRKEVWGDVRDESRGSRSKYKHMVQLNI